MCARKAQLGNSCVFHLNTFTVNAFFCASIIKRCNCNISSLTTVIVVEILALCAKKVFSYCTTTF